MPKTKADREVSNDGITRVVEIETSGGGEDKEKVTRQYPLPATAARFQEMILSLSDQPDGGEFVRSLFGPDSEDQKESPLAFAYRAWGSIIDKMVRARAYETVQAESTLISVGPGKPKFDLMTVPTGNLVIGINGMRGKRLSDLMVLGIVDANAPESVDEVKSVDRKLNFRQFTTAATRLVEQGKARENAASGMLELVS